MGTGRWGRGRSRGRGEVERGERKRKENRTPPVLAAGAGLQGLAVYKNRLPKLLHPFVWLLLLGPLAMHWKLFNIFPPPMRFLGLRLLSIVEGESAPSAVRTVHVRNRTAYSRELKGRHER